MRSTPKTRVRPTEIRNRTAAKTVPSITIVVSRRMVSAGACARSGKGRPHPFPDGPERARRLFRELADPVGALDADGRHDLFGLEREQPVHRGEAVLRIELGQPDDPAMHG